MEAEVMADPQSSSRQSDHPGARLAALESDGYTIFEGLLDTDDVARIRGELAPWLKREKMGRNDFEGFNTERVYALLAKAPSVARIVEHPAVLALIDALLPANYLLSSALAIHVHPGETAQSFHIDDAAGGAPNDRWPRPHYGVSTIWAFDDFTGNNGATEIVPGSHRWPERRPPAPDEIVQVLMPAGSVVVFVGNLLHRGGANTAGTSRLAITPQYCAPWMRQLENMTLAVPPALAARYSARVQALLGYSVVDPGFMGHVDGLHPKRLIDPAYRGRKYRPDLPPS
jgi:ectoine hydroxylase-related dioxygenase (phytanoyl-CoA dioxygenase family)